jgi:MYXO-CTERM domain-containing protein
VIQQPGFQATGVKPALDIAFAPRGEVALPTVVRQDVPELGIKANAFSAIASPNPPPSGTTPEPEPGATKTKPGFTVQPKTGCGCGAADASGGLVFGGLAALVLRRRRR